MFSKILIANRGEIAVRIIRACREMGIKTVAVYSEADREAMHTELADEAVCIGPAPSPLSYLNMKNIISAVIVTGAQAVHPGFGFLSENSKFAEMCSECNIKFIGPDAETIEMMGNKAKAKEIMIKSGIPVIPGSNGAVGSFDEVKELANKMGYPVMLKASAGGGGRGIRIVREESELQKAYSTAQTEALNAFGDDTMYLEKFIENPRHIEFQILGDEYGNIIHLGERDCSIQRRNQKVIEEAPSVALDSELRAKMGETAVKVAKAVGYKNAGTIEFLLDKNKDFYFMETNTRVQVEHGITEMVTGIDIVKEQIRIAAGERLQYNQSDIKISGHSIECRINAENPDKNFRPSPGKIENVNFPGGPNVRIDSAVYAGYVIPPNYDSMVGKLMVHGRDRNEAIAIMKRALGEIVIDGVDTNIDFQFTILNNEVFQTGEIDTSFIPRYIYGG